MAFLDEVKTILGLEEATEESVLAELRLLKARVVFLTKVTEQAIEAYCITDPGDPIRIGRGSELALYLGEYVNVH